MTTLRIQFFRVVAIVFSVSVSFVPVAVAIPQNAPAGASRAGEERKLEGTWRGDSLCVEKGAACHDEVAVYRIATMPGKRGYLMVTGGKVVDGKEIVMGSGEWRYDSEKQTLSVELPRGVITLKLNGDKLEGTFILPDKTVFRRITLKKSD
ncbi:MAG: hypothetical protein DMG47_07990 [Acidobacteria bacterium]|nr:MAG: hypothetical protein DMG47_07990 [Acidobacteriota bacterium]PYT61478.1 MAG: hypothetical protein DMG46_04305 [Acidobacteriota bacterium]